jgi:hypothetical protein
MLPLAADSHSADKSSAVSGLGVCHFVGVTPIALYYRMSIAQLAGSIGTTTQDVLDFLANHTGILTHKTYATITSEGAT